MGKLRIKRRKSRLLAVLFAFIMPGTGHIYTEQYPKGLLLMAAYLLDITAMVRLADSDGGRHLLLIVYLGIMLPVFYFISVFDSLQGMEQDGSKPALLGVTHGILLLSAGIIMLILVKPPETLLPWMNELAELCVGPLLMIAAIILLLQSRKGSLSMFKLGRFTAAALILTVGALLLWDQIQGRNDIALLGQWWPVLFIMLGIETIVFSLKFRQIEKRLRLDVTGGIIAIIITVTAYAVTQYAEIPFRWLDQFNVDLNGTSELGEEKGFRYDKAVVKLPLDEDISLIRINNPNGDVKVLSADVKEIELQTAVWIDLTDKEEADSIAEKSMVKVTPGLEVTLEAKGEAYGANGIRKPRMNMVVTIPFSMSDQVQVDEEPIETPVPTLNGDLPNNLETPIIPETETQGDIKLPIEIADKVQTDSPDITQEADREPITAVKMKVESSNGSIEVADLTLPGGLEIRSNSGLITVRNIKGSINIKGNNGAINAQFISGDSSIDTKNGTINASGILGKLYANTLNGSLELKEIEGSIEAETKNGKIKIDGAAASVKADTLNGNIELNSGKIGGDWDLDSTIGEIKLSIPEDGSFSIYGSVTFGNITTDLPLEVSKKTIRGTMGDGTYRIQINATNSIAINNNRPV